MQSFLFIESRDPFASEGPKETYRLASELGKRGHQVALYLVQNGVLPVRREANAPAFSELTHALNVKIYADDVSLAERGILAHEVNNQVKTESISTLVTLLMEDGRKIVWN